MVGEGGELLLYLWKVLPGEVAGERFAEVAEGPSGDGGVEGEDEEGAEDAEEAYDGPDWVFAAEEAKGADGVAAGATTDDKFADHEWDAEEEGDEEVDDEESTAPVGTGFAGETVDVAESEGGTGGGKDDAEF